MKQPYHFTEKMTIPFVLTVAPISSKITSVKRLSMSQRGALSEFFTNGAVAWMTVGIATPILVKQPFIEAMQPIMLGLILTLIFLVLALYVMKGKR